MHEISIDRVFSAAHAIVMNGEREPVHGHDWTVTVVVAGETLDDDGLLCDFHVLERELEAVIGPFRNADLNATPPFDEVNPTAELVARHIAVTLDERIGERLAPARVASVSVTEAVGCQATFRMP